jgi:hypothetical protein
MKLSDKVRDGLYNWPAFGNEESTTDTKRLADDIEKLEKLIETLSREIRRHYEQGT